MRDFGLGIEGRRQLERADQTRVIDNTSVGEDGYEFVDGGIWANNPVMNALTDALACYDLDRRQVQILSLGCGETAFKVTPRRSKGGLFHWKDVISAAMRAQSSCAFKGRRTREGYFSLETRTTRAVGPP